MKEAYFDLDGQLACIVPKPGGGGSYLVPSGMFIADFMQDGTIISKEEYLKRGGKLPQEK